ncbi:MAG: 30S ribosomal protein S6 [bacterium]
MSKTKKSTIPHYELLYIIPNKYTEEELKPMIAKIHKMITDCGGEITFSEEWGNKKLAYTIKKFTNGYYNLVEFNLAGDKISKIDRDLRMSGEIIRHMIVSRVLRTEEEIQEGKRIEKERRDSEKMKAAQEKQEEKKVVKKVVKKEEKEEVKKKVDLKDLDEKLDKILESDDLL